MFAMFRGDRRRLRAAVWLAALVLLVGSAAALWLRARSVDTFVSAPVRRTTLNAMLTASGILKPVQSVTYRSPLGGRETEITFLAPEGTRVGEGDLLVRLDTTELQRDLDRANQEVRQAQVDLQVADIDRQEGQATVDSLAAGEGALTIDEAKARLQSARKKVDRLREEARGLKPLLDKGFITKEEYRKISDELEQAEEELALADRRTNILVERTHPQDRQRAELQLAQKDAQRENVRARLLEAQARVKVLQEQLENCSAYARGPGLVVYEEYLGASPRRKIRAGDRVTASQGLVTIPDVNRMLLEASVSEGDVHRLHPGQPAIVRLEAFPELRLTGKVARVGTLATSAANRSQDDKRFDLIVDLDPTDAELRPEMTGRADILLGTRENVLVVPINAVFEQNGVAVCHVVRVFDVDTRQVQLGESNDTLVEVMAGLQEGDRVTLTDVGPASDAAPAGTRSPAARGLARGGTIGPR